MFYKFPGQSKELDISKVRKDIGHGKYTTKDLVQKWVANEIIPFLESFSEQWNSGLAPILNKLNRTWKRQDYNLSSRTFDSSMIPYKNLMDSPLLSDLILELATNANHYKDSVDHLKTMVLRLKALSSIKSVLDFEDTPSSYSGAAGKYLGANKNGEIEFLTPYSKTPFAVLSDTPSSYPSDTSVLTVNPSSTIQWKSVKELTRWNITNLTYTGADNQFSTSSAHNEFLQIDIGNTVLSTGFVLTLGPMEDQQRICIKCIAGSSIGGSKYIQPDTGAGVVFNDNSIASYPLDNGISYVFTYSAASSSYYLQETY